MIIDLQNLQIRKSLVADLEVFFLNQLDPEASHMAAFTEKDPTDKAAYLEKWTRILNSGTGSLNTILLGDSIAGNLLTYDMGGDLQISYWIGREYWGLGVATYALKKFLSTMLTRPLYGRVAFDNPGSARVLEKCGFESYGRDKWFANARGQEIVELLYILK